MGSLQELGLGEVGGKVAASLPWQHWLQTVPHLVTAVEPSWILGPWSAWQMEGGLTQWWQVLPADGLLQM